MRNDQERVARRHNPYGPAEVRAQIDASARFLR